MRGRVCVSARALLRVSACVRACVRACECVWVRARADDPCGHTEMLYILHEPS